MNGILKDLQELEAGSDNFEYRFKNYPFYYIASIHKQLQDNLSQSLRPCGMTPQEWRIIAALNEADGMSTTEISALTLLERSRVSRITDSIQEKGWINKKEHPIDKRHSLSFLTDAGKNKFSDTLSVVSKVHRQLLIGFSEEEAELFLSFLKRINANAIM